MHQRGISCDHARYEVMACLVQAHVYIVSTCRWTDNPEQAVSVAGANSSALYFLDHFYDNVQSERKGVTSLNSPKPKLKFSLDEKVCAACPTCSRSQSVPAEICMQQEACCTLLLSLLC